MEIWRGVPQPKYFERYEVSSFGRIRNRKTGKILQPMRTGTRRPGSQRSKVRFSTNPRHDFDVAHLVLEAFVGPRQPGKVCMHADDDSTNNALSNLSWGDATENARAMARRNRGGVQRLGEEEVLDIISRRSTGERGADIALAYGISQQRVCDLFKGRTSFRRV